MKLLNHTQLWLPSERLQALKSSKRPPPAQAGRDKEPMIDSEWSMTYIANAM
jgi:hypothetical protein